MLKRVLCVLLASVMLLGTLASCAETPDDPANETQATGPADSAETEADTKETLDVAKKNYDDTLTFLTRDEAEWSTVEIFAEKLGSDTDNINNAVYERNDRIKNDYGVTIAEIKTATTEHHSSVNKEVQGNNNDFSAIITNAANSAAFSTNHFIHDLNGELIENLDFSKSWWDTRMTEGLSISGKLYFATGDLLTLDNDATFVILFNKTHAKDYKLPNLYELVENKQWTMDKFYELEQLVKSDTAGDGILQYDQDICGFAYTGDAPYCMLFGGGITAITKNADDYPEYNLDIERAQTIAEKGRLIFDKNIAIDMNAAVVAGDTIMHVGQVTFGEDHAMFFAEVMQAVTRMRGYDVDFGILPFPLFNEQQEDYISMMHTTAAMVSIPKNIVGEKLEMTTAMLEAMSYHSVDTLTEQYYEVNLKTKGAKDVESGPMIDKILSSRSCDLCYYYGWGGVFSTLAGTLLPTSNTSVASASSRFKKQVETAVKKCIRTLENDR